MAIRLNKVTKECNVGLQTAVDFLQKQGFTDVEANPNTKITDEQYEMLLSAFSSDKGLKNEAAQMIQQRQEQKKEQKESKEAAAREAAAKEAAAREAAALEAAAREAAAAKAAAEKALLKKLLPRRLPPRLPRRQRRTLWPVLRFSDR